MQFDVHGWGKGESCSWILRSSRIGFLGLAQHQYVLLNISQVDFRLPPWEKPKSGNFPKKDPFAFLLPLYDAYAGPAREQTKDDSRLNPILKPFDETPANILFIIPFIDILVKEQLTMIDRLKSEQEARGEDSSRRFETIIFEKGFHGWLECKMDHELRLQKQLTYLTTVPRGVIKEEDRRKAYDAAIEFISSAHKRTE